MQQSLLCKLIPATANEIFFKKVFKMEISTNFNSPFSSNHNQPLNKGTVSLPYIYVHPIFICNSNFTK